jgi:hypothetical protein
MPLKKVSKETSGLSDTVEQTDLTDIYRAFGKHVLLNSTWNILQDDLMLGHKTCLNTFLES